MNPPETKGSSEQNPSAPKSSPRAGVRRTAILGTVLSVAMLGFGFALVPLYDLFCDLTGFGGRVISAADQPDTDHNAALEGRSLNLRLDATVGTAGRFEFYPQAGQMPIVTGEMTDFIYTVVNKSNIKVVGQAIPSIVPAEAAPYVKKLECFCFTQQVLEANQVMEMPVRFYIDKRLPSNIGEVTLSYVYYDASEQNSELLIDHSVH